MTDPSSIPELEIVPLPHWYKIVKVTAVAMGILAIILLAVSNVITAQAVRDAQETADQIEQSAECRFDRTADISDANDDLDLWTWFGLVAVANSDDAELQRVIEEGNDAARELRNSIQTRAEIVEECSALAEQ